MPPSPSRRRRRALLLAAAALLAAPLAMEGAYRALLALQKAPYDAERLAQELRHVVVTMNQPIPVTPEEALEAGGLETISHVLHPYVGFDVPAANLALSRDLARAWSDGVEQRFDVVVVGGSVSGILVAEGGERLAAALEALPALAGRDVVVHQQGRGSFKQPQQVMLVEYLFALGVVPDLVINVDGFNEVALGMHNAELGIHPLHPHWGRWAHLAGIGAHDPETVALSLAVMEHQRAGRELVRGVLDRGLHRSALIGRFAASRLYGIRGAWIEAQEAYVARLATADSPVRGPDVPAGRDALDVIVRGWVEGSRSIAAACAARGVLYLHVLQPTLHDPGSKPATADELARGGGPEAWIRGVQEGYPRLRAAARELAAEVAFLDASRVFEGAEETLYFDLCHFNRRGNEIFADAIAAALAPRIAAR